MPRRVPVGTRKQPVAALRYAIRDDFQRFNQKNNMIYQGEWNPRFVGLADLDWLNGRKKKLARGNPGYARLDWAYLMGATANTNATRFVINVPNTGGTSWAGLPKVTTGAEGLDDLPEWGGGPAQAAGVIEKVARLFGADDVGICLLDRRWVYSHYYDVSTREAYPIHFSDDAGYEDFDRPGLARDHSLVIPASMKYVITIVHEMDQEGIATAPVLTHMATTLLAYSKISFTAISLAEFIRGLGFQAIPSANDTALNIPLAIDAGLGELGRNAKLIHPVFGPRCRISKVITDLPLTIDHPIGFGVTAFCDSCGKCARKCPGRAIPDGERSYEPVGEFGNYGVLQWQVNHARCRDYWVKSGTNCGLCLQVCPFNKPGSWSHYFTRSVISTLPVFDSWLVRLDDLLGYGKPLPSDRFWAEGAK